MKFDSKKLAGDETGSDRLADNLVSLPTDPLATRVPAPKRRFRREPSVEAQSLDRESVRLAPDRLIPGTRYILRRWLGDGAMGVVYEAEHVDVQRRVAVKILKSSLCELPDAVRAFRAEARAANRVGSRNVVEVFDFAELPDGRVLFAMELVSGITLGDAIALGPLDPARTIGVLRQVCKALTATHAAGVIHRDVKPQNILLSRTDGRVDFVKMLDFGIAAMARDGVTDAAGTPAYMSPEQIAGHEADAKQDMYAVGCLAYEMTCGRVPFMADDATSVLHMHLSQPPTPPSELEPSISPALERVLLRCLAKDPADRYEDMADLEAALCEAQVEIGLTTSWDDLPLPDVDPVRRDRLLSQMPDPNASVRGVRRKWWAIVGAAAVIGAIAGASALALSDPHPSQAEASEIETLAIAARAAGAQAYYVYPPADDPNRETAYHRVLELEGIEGPLEERADAIASSLRDEFAGTLVRLGDYYWDHAGGQPFAMDYYAQALMFDPVRANARERAHVTLGELASLRIKATRSGFTREELLAVAALVPLAEEDPDQRVEALTELAAASDHVSASRDARLNRVIATERSRLHEPAPPVPGSDAAVGEGAAAASASVTVLPPADLVDADEAPDPAAEAVAAMPEKTRPPPADTGKKSTRDPGQARALVEKAKSAGRGNDERSAEALYARALASDNRNRAALEGLGDLYFDRAAYAKSAQMITRAVKQAPRDASLRIKLGDAYFKNLRLTEARGQYERARDLGSKKAASRLQMVADKMGR